MKKTLVLLILSMICALTADIVKPGTYPNLLLNGKLELYAGTFPSSWRNTRSRAEYKIDGGFDNGGRFIFSGKGKSFLIRQDWSFTLEPGERYYLRAKVKATGFKAQTASLLVFNNGWSKEASITLPSGSCDWKSMELVFPGMQSNSGYYSVGIIINGLKSGTLEISDISVEPATKRAFDSSTAYLREIPYPSLVALGRREYIPASAPTLNFRWFGDKKVKTLQYSAGAVKRTAKIAANGVVQFDFSGLKPGKYTVQVKAGKETLSTAIGIKPGFRTVKGKTLNNFHRIVAEIDASKLKSGKFVNSRNGWMYFSMPANMVLRINGVKKTVKNKNSVMLPMGEHSFKVLEGSGRITISEVTETSIYQLGGGPYPKGLPKHSWDFVKKYQLENVMTFMGTGLKKGISEFRRGHNRLLGHASVGAVVDCKKDKKLSFSGLNPRVRWFDGIYLDELALSMQKAQVYFIKNLDKLVFPKDRHAYVYICGKFPDDPYAAAVVDKSINLTSDSKVMAEIYLPNTFTTEKEVKKQVRQLVEYAKKINSVYPGVNPFFGVALCHSNVPLNFSMDNEPEADHRVLLDMQMQVMAVDPAFKNIGLINFWGDNYSDVDRTRWIMALFKHYVIEGNTGLLSEKHGLKVAPRIITNASFRQGTKAWKVKGSVIPGRTAGGSILKRFKAATDSSLIVTLKAGKGESSISQTMKNLTPGRRYKLSLVTSRNDGLQVKINGKVQKKNVSARTGANKKKLFPSFYSSYIFTASAKEMPLEISRIDVPADKLIDLHFVSVFPVVEYTSK